MLLDNAKHFSKIDPLSLPHKGIVVDNEDPEFLGRIKCTISNRWECATEDLPWCEPKLPSMLGGKKELSSLIIPELDTEVEIVFEHNSLYFPRYVGRFHSKKTHHQLFENNYPNVYGFIDSVMQWMRIDKVDQFIELYREINDDLFRVDADGNIWIHIPKSVILKIDESVLIQIGKDKTVTIAEDSCETVSGNHEIVVSGTQGIYSGGQMSHEGSTIHHNSGIRHGTADGDNPTLTEKIAEMQAKIDELKAEAAELKTRQDESVE